MIGKAKHMTHHEADSIHTGMNQAMHDCIHNCTDCHDICLQTIQHGLHRSGTHAEAMHISTMMDCAELCHLCADFMLRGSALHSETCGVCARACEACAKSCALFHDDPVMQRCIDACNKCSESCKQMSAMKMN